MQAYLRHPVFARVAHNVEPGVREYCSVFSANQTGTSLFLFHSRKRPTLFLRVLDAYQHICTRVAVNMCSLVDATARVCNDIPTAMPGEILREFLMLEFAKQTIVHCIYYTRVEKE